MSKLFRAVLSGSKLIIFILLPLKHFLRTLNGLVQILRIKSLQVNSQTATSIVSSLTVVLFMVFSYLYFGFFSPAYESYKDFFCFGEALHLLRKLVSIVITDAYPVRLVQFLRLCKIVPWFVHLQVEISHEL